MSTTRTPMQAWFLGFAALTGLLSLLPYRERALLPVPTATEQGFLAREINNQGTDQIVSNAVTGTSGDPTIGGGAAAAGARRLIPALVRAAGVPGTTSLAEAIGSGATGPAGAGLPGGDTAPGAVNGDAAVNNLAGGTGGLGGQTVTAGQNSSNQVTGPQGPTVLAGTAGELLAVVVPEPSTWLMFVSGLMAVGWATRRSRLRQIRRWQVS